jgi:hypothetical protein
MVGDNRTVPGHFLDDNDVGVHGQPKKTEVSQRIPFFIIVRIGQICDTLEVGSAKKEK